VERETGHWSRIMSPRNAGRDGKTARDAALEEDTLFVCAALGRPHSDLLSRLRELSPGEALICDGRLIAARASGKKAARVAGTLAELAGRGTDAEGEDETGLRRALEQSGLALKEMVADIPEILADLIRENAAAIEADYAAYASLLRAPSWSEHAGVHAIRPDRIRLGEGVRLDPGVVLDAREGPILIGSGTRIMANAVLEGPIAAGPRCLVKAGAKIMGGVSLGSVCKVGGEVEGSILLGFSNKQHDGFLGHSYVGSWVNLGAATDTSDLKNNYGPVRVTVAGRERDTGSRHVGAFLGDHTKTGIHTMLNTGTVAGVFANIFGGGFPPKEIPSFVWGGQERWEEYRLDKALETAALVTSRREVVLTEGERELAGRVFEASSQRRRAWLSQF
jgi:UDP-N-acetylglucosamine diphosphorylase/glucosamine-1-phosphate N-acetyltransferase